MERHWPASRARGSRDSVTRSCWLSVFSHGTLRPSHRDSFLHAPLSRLRVAPGHEVTPEMVVAESGWNLALERLPSAGRSAAAS